MCPLTWWLKTFDSKESAAHRAVDCPRPSHAWYCCSYHWRPARFQEYKKPCEITRTFRRGYKDCKVHLDSFLGWISRMCILADEDETAQDGGHQLGQKEALSVNLGNKRPGSLGYKIKISQGDDHPMTMGHPYGKAGSSSFREAELSGLVVCHTEPASNRLTQEVDDSQTPTRMSTSAPLARNHSTELLRPVRGESGRKLREKSLCHQSSANDHRSSIGEKSERDAERCGIRVSTVIVSESSDNIGASAASPQVKTFVSSSSPPPPPRPKSLKFDGPLLPLPQRKSLNLNGPSPSKSNADSIQTTPTDTSFSHRSSGTNRHHRLSSRTSVSYSDCSDLEGTGVNTSRDTMWGVYDTGGKFNTRRESPPNESPFAKVETWNNEIPINSISAEDRSRLVEPDSSHLIWDTSSPNTVAPTSESLDSNVVSPISPNCRSSAPISNKFLPTRTIAKHVPPVSQAVSLISAARKSPHLGSSDPHEDAANRWLSSRPPHLESGELEHKHMPSDYQIYGTAASSHRPASCGLVASVPRTQWATESSPTQPSLPRQELSNFAGPIHWNNIVESLKPETPSTTNANTTQFDTPDTIDPAFLNSLACSTPLVPNFHEHFGFMYDSKEAVRAEMPVSNLSPIDLNNFQEGLFQLPSPVGYSGQHSPFISPLADTPGSKAIPEGPTPSQLLMQSQSRGLQMSEGEVAGSELDVTSAHQSRAHLANVLKMSSSDKDSPQYPEHWPFLVTHSQSQQTLVEQLQAFFCAVHMDWMRRLKSVPELELRCNVLRPDALFNKGINTLKGCLCGRISKTFECVFSLLHLAIAAAYLLHSQQGSYDWDTLYDEALHWQHALSKDEDKALFLKAMDPKFRPSLLLYSGRRDLHRHRILDESIYTGQHLSLPDALRRSELLKVCIGFLDGLEEAGIGERNLRFPVEELAMFAQSRPRKVQHMINTITRPLQRERGIEALRSIVSDTELRIDRGLLQECREVEVTLLTSGRRSSESPEVLERFHALVTSQCDEARHSWGLDGQPDWRTDHYVSGSNKLLELLERSARQQSNDFTTERWTHTNVLTAGRRKGTMLDSPLSISLPCYGAGSLDSSPTSIRTRSTETPRTETFSSQATSPATLSQDSISPTFAALDTPRVELSCQACSKTFKGTPQDAKSNLNRHLKTSRRHNVKAAGLKCPMDACRDKQRMRGDNLRPHLIHMHKVSDKAERDAIVEECRKSAGRVNSNGVAGRKARAK